MFALIFKVVLFAARSKRGRRLLMVSALSALRLARHPRARRAYAQSWETATDPRPRRAAIRGAKSAARRVKRR